MAKVIMTIAPEGNMCFEEILSFKTDRHVGIWDSAGERFVLMRQSDMVFEPWLLDGVYENLSELDSDVYRLCEEHITDVFDTSGYTIILE